MSNSCVDSTGADGGEKVGQVISIERTALKRQSAAAYFLGSNMNVLCANAVVSELILITLPLGSPTRNEEVVAHVVNRTPYSIDVVVADAHGLVVNSLPLTLGTKDPAGFYRIRHLGSLESFLAEHQELTDQVLAADNQMSHGRLTIARAVYCMSMHPDMSVEFAVASAVQTGERCEALDREMKAAVTALRNRGAAQG